MARSVGVHVWEGCGCSASIQSCIVAVYATNIHSTTTFMKVTAKYCHNGCSFKRLQYGEYVISIPDDMSWAASSSKQSNVAEQKDSLLADGSFLQLLPQPLQLC